MYLLQTPWVYETRHLRLLLTGRVIAVKTIPNKWGIAVWSTIRNTYKQELSQRGISNTSAKASPVLVCYAAILYHTGKKSLPKCTQLIFYCLELPFEKSSRNLAAKTETRAMHGQRNLTWTNAELGNNCQYTSDANRGPNNHCKNKSSYSDVSLNIIWKTHPSI